MVISFILEALLQLSKFESDKGFYHAWKFSFFRMPVDMNDEIDVQIHFLVYEHLLTRDDDAAKVFLSESQLDLTQVWIIFQKEKIFQKML